MKELYNAEYYKNNCGLDYSNKNHWGEFFGYIADKIIADLNPRTVLDAGCAWGYLVAALRDRGVEAYGVDISDYAISKVREDIRPYCMVCSLTEPLPEAFPERYDLVISIEVLEHMYEDKGLIAIRNLCNYSDVILFSSTPDDIDEATHFNVQQPEYWVRNFAKFNFFNQQDYTPSYISDSAMLFHRSSNIARIAEDYQRNIRMLKSEISKLSQYQSENSFVATLYFDYGRSFQAENAIYVQSNTTQFFQEFNIEQGVKAVRFDPVDGRGCIVQNLEILSNNGSLTAINLNGIKEDQFHYFVNTDPQLLINFDEQPIRWVRIKANILTFENIAWFTLLSKFKVLRDKETKIALALVAKEAEVKAALKAKDADTREILSSKDNIIEDHRQLYESVQTELQEYKKNYEDLYVQKEDFKRQLTEVTTSYQIISTSACWKLTEPIRVILDLIKKVRRLSSFTLKSKNKAELFYKGITNIKNKGIRDTLNKVKHYQKRQEDINNFSEQTGSNIENSNLNDLSSFDSEYQENQDFKVIGLDVKTIAFFLPQFHTFPENEEWWGKGFTEWVNTKKARPRFKGHYQPREPHPDIGYYDLSEVEALSRQVKLAKQHGIYGFCFYYYWFSGKRLMEKPVDLLLNNPDLDFPFCFCWANENWTRAWDGLEKEIIMKQQYKDDDADKFILELKRYIDDKRYIRINGKPVIIVYNPGQIPHIENVFTQWRKKAKELGIGEILIWTCQTANNDAEKLKINSFIDAEVEFPPHNMWNEVLAIGDLDLGGREANIFNYQMLVDTIRHKFKTQEKKSDSVPVYRSCMLGWDNAA